MVIGRGSALATSLATSAYTVVPSTLEHCVAEWSGRAGIPIDVLLVSPTTPTEAVEVAVSLRSAGCTLPMLLVCTGMADADMASVDQPWSTLALPASIPDVVSALDALLSPRTALEPPSAPRGREPDDAVIDLTDTPQSWRIATESSPATRAESLDPVGDETRPAHETHEAHRHALPHTMVMEPVVGAVPQRSAPAVDLTGDPLLYDGRAVDLARLLLAMTDSLPSTSGAAGQVLKTGMELVSADAGAVLLSDGLQWRVAAGAGLRPLEWRLELPETHWVVETIARGVRILLVGDSDPVRGRLAPMPLSARPHLLVAPLRRAPGIMILARERPFGPADADRIAGLPLRSYDHVADSLHVRALARALDPLRDLA